ERLRAHRAHETLLPQRSAAAVYGDRLPAGVGQAADFGPGSGGARPGSAAAESRTDRRIHAVGRVRRQPGVRTASAVVRSQQAEDRPADYRSIEYAAGHHDVAAADFARSDVHI